MWGLPKKMSGEFCYKISPVSWLLFYQKLNVLQLGYFLLVATLVLWNLKSKNKVNVSSAWGLKNHIRKWYEESGWLCYVSFTNSSQRRKLHKSVKMWTRFLWLIKQMSRCVQPCYSLNYDNLSYDNRRKTFLSFTLFDITVFCPRERII